MKHLIDKESNMSPRYSLLMLALSPVLLTAKVFAADAASAKTLEAVEIKASETILTENFKGLAKFEQISDIPLTTKGLVYAGDLNEVFKLFHDEKLVRDAVKAELARGGQVFYLHNRVETIQAVAERIAALGGLLQVGAALQPVGLAGAEVAQIPVITYFHNYALVV